MGFKNDARCSEVVVTYCMCECLEYVTARVILDILNQL